VLGKLNDIFYKIITNKPFFPSAPSFTFAALLFLEENEDCLGFVDSLSSLWTEVFV
jgi:hypothetical protein